MRTLLRKWLTILFVLLTAPVQAQLISYPPQKIMGFRGLDTRSSAPNIVDSRAIDLLNVKLSSALNLEKRPGVDVVNDSSLDDLDLSHDAITGIFDAEYSNGMSHTLAFVGSKIKYDNSGTWSTITGGTNAVTAGKDNQVKCIMALDEAICTNDVDVPFKVNSTPAKTALDTSGLADSLDKVKSFVWFRNYLIAGNTVENSIERPTRVRYSNVGTIETWSDDDFFDISTFAGDELVGFVEMYGDLYVFLTKSIWRVSLVGGDDVFISNKVIDNIGAIARDSIQLISLSDNRTAVMFIDNRKRILMFNGATLTHVGNSIQPSLDTLNESRLQYAAATFDGDEYIIALSGGGSSSNNVVYVFHSEIFEWTKYDQIDANAFAQVKETTSTIKTYYGNYDAFVYWMDNPDLANDVDGASGIVESVATTDTSTITGAQILIDSDITTGVYTGAIVRITSGTGAGQEAVVSSSTSTGVIVASAFSTTPDSTSVYSIGDINAFFHGKHYELGDAAREKAQFLGMLIWGEEQAGSMVDVSYAIDFGSNLGSETVSLSPSAGSLWDTALWDDGVWGTTGDKIFTVKFTGNGNFIQPKFANNDIDETFNIYGFNIIAVSGDIKQP